MAVLGIEDDALSGSDAAPANCVATRSEAVRSSAYEILSTALAAGAAAARASSAARIVRVTSRCWRASLRHFRETSRFV